MSQIFKPLFLTIVSIAIAGSLVEMVTRVIFPQWSEFLSERFMARAFIPRYGAVTLGRPGFDGYFAQNNGDFRTHVKINDFGLRNSEPVNAAAGKVWIVGDSVAFGWGVSAEKMLSGRLQAEVPPGAYNIASPGTDVCGYQALIARMPVSLKPRAAIVVLTLENDIRTYDCAAESKHMPTQETGPTFRLSTFKQLMMKYSAFYNLIAVVIKRNPALTNILTGLGLVAKSHIVASHFPVTEIALRAVSTAQEIAKLRDMFDREIAFGVLLVPSRFELRDDNIFFAQIRTNISRELQDIGLDVIDPFTVLREAGFVSTHFTNDGHWSENGHAAAAKVTGDWLQRELRQ